MEKALINKIDSRTKPKGSLGMLESIALQIGMIQKTLTPEFHNPTILVFAADHGIADEGVSPCPKEITYQMVMNFVNGGAGINVFTRQNGITLKVIDAGVDHDFPDGISVIDAKIAKGTRNMLYEPAMSIDLCYAAIEKGRELVRNEHKNGCNVIGFGEMGIANSSSASLLLHKYGKFSLEECVGPGAGHSPAGVEHKLDVLKRVSAKYNVENSIEILATFGGLEIAMMCGAILEAKKLEMVILADGFIATSAFIAAHEIEPEILKNTIFSHSSGEKGHRLMLQHLNGTPVLNLGLRLGEGTGVAIAYPVIKSSLVFLNEMASFENASVTRV